MVCRFDGSLARVALSTPEGCVCFPEDKQQLLCAQHYINDGMHSEEILWIDPAFEEWLNASRN